MAEQKMIERVARACFLAHWPADKWERFGPKDYVCEQYRGMARAAILAMRGVTPAMLSAAASTPGMSDVDKIIASHAVRSGHDTLAGHSESPFAQGWKAAIDAILTEDQTNASR